jgi:hypothetical protein
VIFLVIEIISAITGGFLWSYSINSWLAFAGRPEIVKFWHGMLLGCCPIIGQFSIPVAIITYIAMMIM